MEAADKYGAQVYPLKAVEGAGSILVKQLVKRGGKYVVDGQRERHVDLSDDQDVAAAIRDALRGLLPKGKAR